MAVKLDEIKALSSQSQQPPLRGSAASCSQQLAPTQQSRDGGYSHQPRESVSAGLDPPHSTAPLFLAAAESFLEIQAPEHEIRYFSVRLSLCSCVSL